MSKGKMPRPVTIDTETYKIEGRETTYPPRPVGVSIKYWGKPATYYGFGHLDREDPPDTHYSRPSDRLTAGNTHTYAEALEALKRAYAHPEGVLFQNAKFDLDVIEKHFGLALPAWDRVHDVIYLLFLHNPHARDLGLKLAAKTYLGIEMDDQDEVAQWLVLNQPRLGHKIKANGSETAGFMLFIPWAPAPVVGKYANRDCERTEGLFRHLWPLVEKAKMLPAYDRERELLPILLGMERTGIRVDMHRLADDIARYQMAEKRAVAWIRERLGVPPDDPTEKKKWNFNSAQQLLDAMKDAGVVNVSAMGVTVTKRKPGAPAPKKARTPRVSMTKQSIQAGVTDPLVAAMIQYRNQLQKCLNTFMVPWLRTASLSGGLIFTSWHQTRSEGAGARTGRFSSSHPNFQNMPNEFAPIWAHERESLPVCPIELPPLPLCRGYIIPWQSGDVLAGRDYSQQEPRILAHFEDGALKERYIANPWIDFHDDNRAQVSIHLKKELARKPIKNIGLGLIYGQGAASLAAKNGQTLEETKALKDAVLALYPGLKELNDDMKSRARRDEPFRTWGGRVYYCEPPYIEEKEDGEKVSKSLDYKMTNALIQGSAADCTKEAIIRYHNHPLRPAHHRLILLVHDELVLSLPASELAWGMEILRACMESVSTLKTETLDPFDVLILSEGAWSSENWGRMQPYDVKGKIVANDSLPKQKKAA